MNLVELNNNYYFNHVSTILRTCLANFKPSRKAFKGLLKKGALLSDDNVVSVSLLLFYYCSSLVLVWSSYTKLYLSLRVLYFIWIIQLLWLKLLPLCLSIFFRQKCTSCLGKDARYYNFDVLNFRRI